jgi:hypothetical protein
MSKPVGYQYKSRIPTLSDDATIEEALSVYHYGIDNWSTEEIPDDSIEGNFRGLNVRMASAESQLSGLSGSYVELISQTLSPNVLTGQSTTTIPIAIRAISSQTAPLQQWQNSSSVSVGGIGVAGNMNLAGYLTLGSTTQATTTGLSIIIGNAVHKGIVIKAQNSQTVNIQEWQNSSGTALSWINKDGKFYYDGHEILGGSSYSSESPTNPAIGNLWVDSDTLETFVYTGSGWVSTISSFLSEKVTGDGISSIVALTQAEYDSIVTKDPSTLYVVTP